MIPTQSFVLVVPWWAILLALGTLAIVAYTRGHLLPGRWEAVSADIGFAGLGKFSIRPNHNDIQLAHRAWVELATRKSGVPFDEEHDLISEVYDSWYELFARLRLLTGDCSASRLRSDENTRKLVFTLVTVLNRGIRPHLTRWQACFRKWYAHEIAKAQPEESPQDIQRRFPDYDELVVELIAVQNGLQRYMSLLRELSTGVGVDSDGPVTGLQ